MQELDARKWGFATISIAIAATIATAAFAQDVLDLPMNREGSGTAWQPDSTPMYARGFMLDGWSMMAHGIAFGGYDYQGSRRGGGQVFSTNWGMLMAEHEFLEASFGARLMMSGEFTDGGAAIRCCCNRARSFTASPIMIASIRTISSWKSPRRIRIASPGLSASNFMVHQSAGGAGTGGRATS